MQQLRGEFSLGLLMTTIYCQHGKNQPSMWRFMASQRNYRVSAGENSQGKLPCWEQMLGLDKQSAQALMIWHSMLGKLCAAWQWLSGRNSPATIYLASELWCSSSGISVKAEGQNWDSEICENVPLWVPLHRHAKLCYLFSLLLWAGALTFPFVLWYWRLALCPQGGWVALRQATWYGRPRVSIKGRSPRSFK